MGVSVFNDYCLPCRADNLDVRPVQLERAPSQAGVGQKLVVPSSRRIQDFCCAGAFVSLFVRSNGEIAMDKSTLVLTEGLSPAVGFAVIIGLGIVMLCLALAVRSMIRTTDDYVAAGRRIGLGFGVGSVIAVWTWSVAVLTSAAVTYSWGISGLLWFVVPNGLAIMVLAPFALHLRKKLPAGYTITQFIKERFNNPAATAAVLAVIVFTAGMSILT